MPGRIVHGMRSGRFPAASDDTHAIRPENVRPAPPGPLCGYKIAPHELIRTDDEAKRACGTTNCLRQFTPTLCDRLSAWCEFLLLDLRQEFSLVTVAAWVSVPEEMLTDDHSLLSSDTP